MDIMYMAAAFPAIIIALSLHEYGHAAMAVKMGDPTPKMMGRLTLNPIAHMDPMGTFMIIITMFMGFGFGWGKPVQTNPSYYSDYRTGTILVAIAGPAMNLAQAMLAVAVGFMLYSGGSTLPAYFHKFLAVYIMINIVLMVFNLLPIPPLDGGHVTEQLLPYHLKEKYRQFGQYGMLVLLGLMWFGVLGMIINFFFMLFFQATAAGFGVGYANFLIEGLRR